MQIAQTILQQLGGQRFKVMTGAKDFTATERGLVFRVPGSMTREGINHVEITLTPRDEYRIDCRKIRGTKVAKVTDADGVYCDNLQAVFTRLTGLYTKL